MEEEEEKSDLSRAHDHGSRNHIQAEAPFYWKFFFSFFEKKNTLPYLTISYLTLPYHPVFGSLLFVPFPFRNA